MEVITQLDTRIRNSTVEMLSCSQVKRRLAARLGDLTTFSKIDQRKPSTEARGKIVALSKLLLEDYIYNRLSQLNYSDCFTPPISPLNSDLVQPIPNSPTISNISFLNTRSSMALSIDFLKYSKWKDRQPEVALEIQRLGSLLEQAYPHLYENLSPQLRMPLKSLNSVTKALTHIGDYMFQDGVVNWGRIVGLFAVSGAMALEVLLNDNARLVAHIADTFSQIIDRHAAVFIHSQGGWAGVLHPDKPEELMLKRFNSPQWYGRILGFSFTAYILYKINNYLPF